MKPGIYEMSAASYHQDPCERPSLSASIASILCSATPLHAWTAHPLLNPRYRPREDEKFDIGTAAHELLLEGGEGGWKAVEVFADDWRTKAAREARDEIRAWGRMPLLSKDYTRVLEMVTAAREQLAAHGAEPELFTDGKPEQTLVWEEPGNVLCRARLDWLRNDYWAIDDLKTTSRSADPGAYSRNLYSVGGDIQASFYVRGVYALTGKIPEFRWAVVETSPPYALSVIAPGPDVLTIGRKKVEYAIDLWRHCLENDDWPGYPRAICFAELPAWEEASWLEKETRVAA